MGNPTHLMRPASVENVKQASKQASKQAIQCYIVPDLPRVVRGKNMEPRRRFRARARFAELVVYSKESEEEGDWFRRYVNERIVCR
jgi:hypothetical protein